jgi:hypothetical protein
MEQGGVRLNGNPVSELGIGVETLHGALLQVGKRRFAVIVKPEEIV